MAAFDLLMAENPADAGPLALQLDDQNRERQQLTQTMQLEAEDLFADQETAPLLIFAYKPEFEFQISGPGGPGGFAADGSLLSTIDCGLPGKWIYPRFLPQHT